MLETVRKKNTPVFLGPVLIHYWKTLLSRELEGVRGFGTDGGEALSDAFKHEFGFAKRLTCFVHVRSNLKDKLAECNIFVDLLQKILDDVFGKRFGTVFVEGIVDASDDCDFQNKLDAVTQACRSCSLPSTANLERFISTNDAIVPAPGQDLVARMVLSYSGKIPHMVTPKKGGEFSCDSSCPNWKSMGICAHSVAVAEINKKLTQFCLLRRGGNRPMSQAC